MRSWMEALTNITGTLRRRAVEGLREGIGNLPWAWRTETESQLQREGATESQLGRRKEELAGDWTGMEQYQHRLAAEGAAEGGGRKRRRVVVDSDSE